MGGALKAVDLVDWVLYMVACNALPPVPAVFGDGWRDEWARRVDGTDPWLLRWLEEQADGPYWRHGSVRPGYERIACPTMLVAGWADGYTNIALRGFEALECSKRLLLGPWSHSSTATSLPGPHIDLVPELIRWFGRWLRDEPNGIDEEPPIAVFARHSAPPRPAGGARRMAERGDVAAGAARARDAFCRRDRERRDPRAGRHREGA
jgi:predicted acyl esterase